jgi:hypothetical protein
MQEVGTDLEELQAVLDRSVEAGGAHLLSIFDRPHRVTAEELVAELDDIVEMHLAVVTADGTPLVAPVDGILYRGRLWFGLPPASVRARLVRRDPRVSVSFARGSFAVIAHGTAQEVDEQHPFRNGYDRLVDDLYTARYGPAWRDWRDAQRRAQKADGFIGYLEPRVLFAKR